MIRFADAFRKVRDDFAVNHTEQAVSGHTGLGLLQRGPHLETGSVYCSKEGSALGVMCGIIHGLVSAIMSSWSSHAFLKE